MLKLVIQMRCIEFIEMGCIVFIEMRCIEFIEMGCQRLTYHQKTSSKTESTPIFVMGEKQGSDYQVFGMQMPGRTYNSDDYRYGFNGMEKDDEVKGSGNHYDLGLRNYDPRIGRMFSMDPRADEYPWQTTYAYHRNSPIMTIDYLGGGDGIYVDERGNVLGEDEHGDDDGEVYLVTDRKERRKIKKSDRKGESTKLEDIESKIKLPKKEIRKEMAKVKDMVDEDSFREYGGGFGLDGEGNSSLIWAKPGDKADPSEVKEATINVFDAANPNEKGSLAEIQGTFHTHPSGTVTQSEGQQDQMMSGSTIGGGTTTTHSFIQTPSDRDVKNAANRSSLGIVTGNSYVIGAGDNTVYIYDGSGVQATFPLSEWSKVGL